MAVPDGEVIPDLSIPDLEWPDDGALLATDLHVASMDLMTACPADMTGDCVHTCVATADCPCGLKCDVAMNACVQCLSSADCPQSFTVCSGDRCVSPPDLNMFWSTTPCDVARQNCCNANKCTAVGETVSGVDNYSVSAATCIPSSGVGGEGDACTRTSAGHDDCASGLFCTTLGDPKLTDLHCRRLCLQSSIQSNQGCGASTSCFALMEVNVFPRVSVCLPGCRMFGNDCPAGQDCSLVLNNFLYGNLLCRSIGTTPIGGACKSSLECVAGAQCLGVCRLLCDATHPCPSPLTCDSSFLGHCY